MVHRNRLAGPVCLLATALLLGPPSPADVRAESKRYMSVPALAAAQVNGQLVGNVHYIVLQLDRDPQGRGPTILFSESTAGSAVDEVWKDGARAAIAAAARIMGEDVRNWALTIRNRSRFSLSSGSSASSAMAVGIIAAWRGDDLRSGVVLTGVITPEGRIEDVGDLPAKLQGAVAANMHAMLVPKGEAKTDEWDLYELGRQRNITVVEVSTLQEAYEIMTGIRP
jgi:predicted S18 family serine protease